VARQSTRPGRAASATLGSGVLGRLTDRAFENPAASGGLLVMAITAGAIAVNATFLQSPDHPRSNPPSGATSHIAPQLPPVPTERPAVTTPPLPAIAPQQATRPAATAAPNTAATAKPAAKPASAPASTAAQSGAPVADVQRELARLGLYSGPIDGIAGPRTKAAIVAYQSAAGVAADGEPSSDLLALMMAQPSARPAISTAPAAPRSTPTASVRPTPIPPGLIPMPAESPAADTYRRVQTALNQIGYGPIPVDGKAGPETADAIRRFELDYGLPITGVPGDTVTKRLTAMGALATR
jgi:peptidoglycan hydrolase-like protein with peptidoglycan-binding domain